MIGADDDIAIATYTKNLPDDLKTIATTALRAERFNATNCGDALRESSSSSSCPPSKFRTATGKCNNVRHPMWGNRGVPFLRKLPPVYRDGRSRPRNDLPNPTKIIKKFVNDKQKHESLTALVGAWSELILQDLAATGNFVNQDCCINLDQHEECYLEAADDNNNNNNNCRQYMRSLPSIDLEDCSFEYRNQMNLATSFLDASAVYGNTADDLRKLRTYDAGLVNISQCLSCKSNALYSAILKEHNRIAINLAKINRHWDDEILFYEARRIVAAEIQHITYNEYLPIILGNEAMIQSDLALQSHGRFSKYSSSNKAGIYNEVALAALPALLSMIPHALKDKSPENFAEMVDILIKTEAQSPSVDMMVTLRDDFDTAALFMLMARDHGIRGYVDYLRLCQNDTEVRNFDDLINAGIDLKSIEILKVLYRDVNDIDLLLGGILEKTVPGAVIGKTLNCLLRDQFVLLKQSDRFWYENDLPPSSLSSDQLKEIKKITLAALLCANTDQLDKIQSKPFFLADPYLNYAISCKLHTLPDLTPWLEMDHMTDFTEDVLMDALNKAEQEILQRRKMEYQLWAVQGGVDPKSPVGTAASFSKANKQALKLANSSLLFEFASNEIINSLEKRRRRRRHAIENSLSSVLRSELSEDLQNVDISALLPAHLIEEEDHHCDDSGPCDPSYPYRTMTGHCNNLHKPDAGKSLTTFARLLPSVYDDGISKPRTIGATGSLLPTPRSVSTLIHPDISNLHQRYTLMTMQFAQFVDHDLTMTPIHKGFHESIPDCRPCDSSRTVHPECNPFPIPPGDHYFPNVNITSGAPMCFPFMRSLPGQLQLGPREQVNQNTAFLDASMVYGENHCVLRQLKGTNGLMNCTERGNLKPLLPQSDHHPECKSKSGLCYIAGDGRASEQPGLTVIHTIFMREHNRVADELRRINPHWNDDKMFEEARKIVIAETQHITYNEFLPRLLSWNVMNLYGLKLQDQGYYKEYSSSCNPAIFTEFAAAAYRIGHSLLRPHIPRMSPNYQVLNPPILLRDGFFKMDMFQQPSMMDEIARGLLSTPIETLDQFITGEVTNHLFEDTKTPFSGIDLIALNVQRARDHGIPSYNNYRALCNLKRATTFEDLEREIPIEVINRFKQLYASVDDIDLFPGGMSERPLQGGLVGPTFGCIIALQFRQLRKCDRFWYENDDPTVRFTEAQLGEIRKSTLAKMFCDNMDIPGEVQRAAFDLPANFLNPRVPCSALPSMNLEHWRESGSGGCVIGDRQVGIGESGFPSPCTSCICSDEGTKCASLRVTDCNQLLREWPKETILKDDVCSAQCGFLLQRTGHGASSLLNTDLTPPPPLARIERSRHVNFQFKTHSDFNFHHEFSFPDLSVFIDK